MRHFGRSRSLCRRLIRRRETRATRNDPASKMPLGQSVGHPSARRRPAGGRVFFSLLALSIRHTHKAGALIVISPAGSPHDHHRGALSVVVVVLAVVVCHAIIKYRFDNTGALVFNGAILPEKKKRPRSPAVKHRKSRFRRGNGRRE